MGVRSDIETVVDICMVAEQIRTAIRGYLGDLEPVQLKTVG